MPLTPIPALDRTAATFKTDVDTFFGTQIPGLVTEINALETDLTTKHGEAVVAAANAEASESNAALSAALAAAGLNASLLGLTVVNVSGTTHSAAAGTLISLENAAATTVTFPASPSSGDLIGICASNGRFDNIVNPNGKTIQGASGNMTMDVPYMWFKYFGATAQWRGFV